MITALESCLPYHMSHVRPTQQGKTPAELAKYSGDFEIQNLFGCETIAI